MFPVSDVIPPRRVPIVTIAIIVAGTSTFVYEVQLDRPEVFDLARRFGVVPAALSWPGLFTSLFIHDGWVHLAANMLYLWIFGANVEDSMGRPVYLFFYLGAGCVGALVHAGLHPASARPLIGATCAIAAVLGAYFVVFPKSQVLVVAGLLRAREAIEVPAALFLAAWILLMMIRDFHSIGAHAADVTMTFGAEAAGFATGVAAGAVLRWRGRLWELSS